MRSNFKSPKPAIIPPEDIAAAILVWLADEPDMLSRFLALSGMTPADLRAAAGDAGFQAGLLDFIMAHEPTLVSFCDTSGTPMDSVAAAWHRLSGPGLSSGES